MEELRIKEVRDLIASAERYDGDSQRWPSEFVDLGNEYLALAERLAAAEAVVTAARALRDDLWCNKGKPKDEFISVSTPMSGRTHIRPTWIALDEALDALAPEVPGEG